MPSERPAAFAAALLLLWLVLSASPLPAVVIERIAAFIDDEAITLTEFEDYLERARRLSPDLSEEEAMNTLINRRLLLREAKRLRIRGGSDDEIVREYINIRIRSYIKVPPEEVESYYATYRDRFGKARLSDVRQEIERLLREKEINRRLQRHIEELRKRVYIKVNLPSALP